jgi:SAM-dependent methyltransferase
MSGEAHDPATLAFYDREATTYAARNGGEPSAALTDFMAALAPGAAVLELGCGGGRDSVALIAAGFQVTPTDGSAGLAAVAEKLLGLPVRVMRFDDLEEVAAYDGVWANACLLHAPAEALPEILARVRRALKPGGRFFASYKSGQGGDRDSLGRYYNFPTAEGLRAAYDSAGPWAGLSFAQGEGGGYDGVMRTWLQVTATV